MNNTEPVTRTCVTYTLITEYRPGHFSVRSRGDWQQVQDQLIDDQGSPQLAGKRRGIIRTDIIEVEHPVEWLAPDQEDHHG